MSSGNGDDDDREDDDNVVDETAFQVTFNFYAKKENSCRKR